MKIIALLIAALCSVAPAALAQVASPSQSGTLDSVRDCELRYHVHGPATPREGPAVVIAHGFMRTGEFMTGWAEAIERAGLTAVTVDMCASAAPGGRHADNGTDLVALRRALGFESVVYVGVSAGGLAALIAASLDGEATRGLLLLDPTNAGGQARRAASRIDAPVAALIAKPQICNAWRNIDPALEMLRDATILRIDGASHCDFEWPTNAFCRVACVAMGSGERHDRAQRRIRDVGLSFIEAIRDNASDALPRWKASIGEMP